MGSRLAIFLATGLLVLLAASGSYARTWHVEKDGTGDFSVIQDAVEAAATDDTISIGAGRYSDFHYDLPGGWSVVRVSDKNLTFIGDGPDLVQIGPNHFGSPDNDDVYCVVVLGDGLVTRLRGLTFDRVVSCGVRIEREGRCEIDDCVFRDSSGGFFGVLRDGGWIRNCQFINNDTEYGWPAVDFYTPTVGVVVENCRFTNCRYGVNSYWPGCSDIAVNSCIFTGGRSGVGFIDGASGAVTNCDIAVTDAGIVGSSAGSVRIEDNYVRQTGSGGCAFYVYWHPGDFYLRNNVFEAEWVVMWILTPLVNIDARDNHFIRTSPTSWFARPIENQHYSGDPIHLDLTGNWWGTDNPAEVAQWIWDGNDDPDQHYFFDYLPMLGGPVPTEAVTWGAVKSLFRDEGQ